MSARPGGWRRSEEKITCCYPHFGDGLFYVRMTKNFGGSMTLELEPNQKLEMITWKDDSLWYLTRPMTESDTPETHTFQLLSLAFLREP